MHCPKCDADISDSYQDAEPDVGIMSGGYYCEACDLPVDDDYEPMEGDVPIMTATEARGGKPLGTPLSEISVRPGEPGYAEWVRISKSWGYD